MNFEGLINLFSKEYSIECSFENTELFNFRLRSNLIIIPTDSELQSSLLFISTRDSFKLSIKLDLSDTIELTERNSVKTFLTELSKVYSNKEPDEDVVIDLDIRKQGANGRLSIYSFEIFSSSLNELAFFDVIDLFGESFKRGILIFEVIDSNFKSFYTTTISFINPEERYTKPLKEVDKYRSGRIKRISGITHVLGISFPLLPDDFDIRNPIAEYQVINHLFHKLTLVGCLSSLFDITTIASNGLSFRLNGYKAIEGFLTYSQLTISSLDEYLRIYYWIYESGNLTDKIGLSRNIISLHINKENLELSGSPYYSIESAFVVYLRENIRQYIEIRNKISDQLIDFNKRATLIVDSFASSFQKSAFAVFTTFSAILAIKYLGVVQVTTTFASNAAIFSLVFIIISALYLYVSKWDIKMQKDRFISSYGDLKKRYTDLLVTEDIERILNFDAAYDQDLAYINQKEKRYTQLWMAVLIAMALITISFYYTWLLEDSVKSLCSIISRFLVQFLRVKA